MSELAVLIPSRNEEWLNRTVTDVLEHARADTEVIAVLDGAWPLEPLKQHPKLNVVYLPASIGQRACTNLAARLTDAPYIMKLDAHCSVAEGFDRVLLDSAQMLGPDVVQVPAQKNLHAYDWVCDACGRREYQCGLTACRACDSEQIRREMVWKPKRGVTTTRWSFDHDLKFQYWNGGPAGDITETMSCIGACWFQSREQFLTWGGLDEGHGSWGQVGTEIGCKAWLSGGRLVTNHQTWFAHFFRVGGHQIPYPLSGNQQEAARVYSRNLWLQNGWPLQKRPLKWLVEKFQPNGWTPEQVAALQDLTTTSSQSTLQGVALETPSDEIAPIPKVGSGGKFMPADAVGLGGSLSPTSGIGGRSDECHMGGVAAMSPATTMVQLENTGASANRNWSDQPSEHQTVDLIPSRPQSDLSIAATDRFSPKPATSDLINVDRRKNPTDLASTQVRNRKGIHRGKAILYYSDGNCDRRILDASRRTIELADLPIVAVTLAPVDWPSAERVVLPLDRGYLTLFRQILVGLEIMDSDYVFFAEHDLLYHATHFSEVPVSDQLTYNEHVYKVSADDGRALHYRCAQTSGLSGPRKLLLEHYRKRVDQVEARGFSRGMGFEPGTHGRPERVDDLRAERWMSSVPNVDIRHGQNLTRTRWRKDQFRNQKYTAGWTESATVPGWGTTSGRFQNFLDEVIGDAALAAVS